MSIIFAGEFGLLLLFKDTVTFDMCLTTLVKVSRASSGKGSIIGAIAAAGVLREGRNAVDYIRDVKSEGKAGSKGQKERKRY